MTPSGHGTNHGGNKFLENVGKANSPFCGINRNLCVQKWGDGGGEQDFMPRQQNW